MLKDLCFEVIHKCPNECKFCSSNSSSDKTKIISLDLFKKTVNHFINQGGIEEISISGGEPFLHPNLFEIVEFCKDKGIKTVIFTSGVKKAKKISNEEINYIKEKCNQDIEKINQSEPWNDRLKQNVKKYYDRVITQNLYSGISRDEFRKLKILGLDKIVFDFQAADFQIDKELMGRKEYNPYLLDSIVKASLEDLNIDVHFIPMKPNYKQFPDIIEILKISKIKNISILNFVPQGRGELNKSELILNQEELKEFSEILKKEQERFSGNIRIGIPLNGKISHLCTAGTEKLDIKYDGTVLPCPAFKEISVETLEKYGIRLYNIYDDLEKIVVHSGKRITPLCKKIYGFEGGLEI